MNEMTHEQRKLCRIMIDVIEDKINEKGSLVWNDQINTIKSVWLKFNLDKNERNELNHIRNVHIEEITKQWIDETK